MRRALDGGLDGVLLTGGSGGALFTIWGTWAYSPPARGCPRQSLSFCLGAAATSKPATLWGRSLRRRVLDHRVHSCAQEGIGGLGREYNTKFHQLVKETNENERKIHTLCRVRTCCTPHC